METQVRKPPPRAERDSSSNLSNSSGLKGGDRSLASSGDIDGGSGGSGVGTSNGAYDASIGDPKIGSEPPSAAAGVGGRPASNDTALRWARICRTALAFRWLGLRVDLDLLQEGWFGLKLRGLYLLGSWSSIYLVH